LNGSLTKAGVQYTTLWSSDFTDDFFRNGLKNWLNGDPVAHDSTHVHPLRSLELPENAAAAGAEVARELMGVFDEGCMGMYNAIIPDELLHPTGIFKERLSQSALYAAMRAIPPEEAQEVRSWLDAKGMRFKTGPDPATELTAERSCAGIGPGGRPSEQRGPAAGTGSGKWTGALFRRGPAAF
jgi:hypothetical protein